MTSEAAVILGLTVGATAVVIWAIVFVRTLIDWKHGDERRTSWVLMSATALLAAIGALASSIGYGMQTGVIHLDLPQPLFSFIASVGRGALLAGGALVLSHRIPPKRAK
jgi:hypothetical protein